MCRSIATRQTIDSDRRGITKVEVLVILVVVAIAFGLAVPAIQAQREAARRLQCSNNIKQLGLGLHTYHTAYGKFPPSSVWRSPKNWTELDIEQTAVGNNPNLAADWMILILPVLEQSETGSPFDLSLPITDDTSTPTPWTDKLGKPGGVTNIGNRAGRGMRMAVMLCPSDSYNLNPFNGSASKLTDKLGDGWARGNYAANASLGYMATSQANPHGAADAKAWRNPLLCGVMGANVSLRLEEITDGTANTILLGEIRAGIIPQDPRGVWAMANASGSALWGHGYTGDDNGPNCRSLRGDGIVSGSEVWAAAGGGPALERLGMSCDQENHPNWQQTARSAHFGGVTVCMADGSVRFITDSVELGAAGDPPRLGVWDKLNLSNDGRPLVEPQDATLP